MRSLRRGGAWFVVLLALYLGLISSISWLELVVGTAGALVGAAAAVGAARAEGVRHSIDPRWLRWLLPTLAAVVVDTGRLVVVLARRLTGRPVATHEVTLTLPPDEPPARRAGRRAVATLLVSATPSGLVVDVEEDEHRLVVHTLGTDEVGRTGVVAR